jgi:hypothetical protein
MLILKLRVAHSHCHDLLTNTTKPGPNTSTIIRYYRRTLTIPPPEWWPPIPSASGVAHLPRASALAKSSSQRSRKNRPITARNKHDRSEGSTVHRQNLGTNQQYCTNHHRSSCKYAFPIEVAEATRQVATDCSQSVATNCKLHYQFPCHSTKQFQLILLANPG